MTPEETTKLLTDLAEIEAEGKGTFWQRMGLAPPAAPAPPPPAPEPKTPRPALPQDWRSYLKLPGVQKAALIAADPEGVRTLEEGFYADVRLRGLRAGVICLPNVPGSPGTTTTAVSETATQSLAREKAARARMQSGLTADLERKRAIAATSDEAHARSLAALAAHSLTPAQILEKMKP